MILRKYRMYIQNRNKIYFMNDLVSIFYLTISLII